MKTLYIVVGLVALQRLAEVAWSNHNIRSLKAKGAIEAGSRHYPLFFLVHGSWLLAILLLTPASTPVEPWALLLYCILQVGRLWVLLSLGGYWTTRVITLPGPTTHPQGALPLPATSQLSNRRLRNCIVAARVP